MINNSPTWHPFTQMKGAGPFPMVTHAKDCMLYLENGEKLIDAISSWWVITHGHCRPEIVSAVQHQCAQLDQVIFAGFTHPMAERVAQELVALTPPHLTRVFFSDDGSTSVEVAVKMAVQACAQRGEPQRNKFLALAHAYHGDTLGAMSVGGESVFTSAFRDLMFQVIRADHASHSQASVEDYTRDFLDKLDRYESELAAVILEPLVQGAGGMIVWPEEAVVKLAQACKERGILLIFDEVMTGFGRTGANFVMDKLGLQPDLVCLSKGLTAGTLPLAVTMATDEIYAAFLSDDRSKTFFHGHSFTANPIACAAAAANLELMKQPEAIANLKRIETLHKQRLAKLGRGDVITDQRMCGTIAAVEIKTAGQGYLASVGPAMSRHAREQGVLLRPLGNVIYILPPYCMSDSELNRVWDVLESCLDLAGELLS